MVLFPDMRSSCVASALLLKRYREEIKGSKYFILVSWPGFGGLFPFVNEYWEVSDESLPGPGHSARGLVNDADFFRIFVFDHLGQGNTHLVVIRAQERVFQFVGFVIHVARRG